MEIRYERDNVFKYSSSVQCFHHFYFIYLPSEAPNANKTMSLISPKAVARAVLRLVLRSVSESGSEWEVGVAALLPWH